LLILASLSNADGEGKESAKKVIGFVR